MKRVSAVTYYCTFSSDNSGVWGYSVFLLATIYYSVCKFVLECEGRRRIQSHYTFRLVRSYFRY